MKLVAELRANNQQLTQLGMVTPIIETIKNIIDDKKDRVKDKKLVQLNITLSLLIKSGSKCCSKSEKIEDGFKKY